MTTSKALRSITDTVAYFDYFSYPVTEKEIYTYYPGKITLPALRILLDEAVRRQKLEFHKSEALYTLRGHRILVKKRAHRWVITQQKVKRIDFYLKALYSLPYIELIGLSGSCAMHNAKQSDDVDLFIISAPGRIWLSRITAILLAKVMGIHRSRGMKKVHDKVCLNLFFDADHLGVPPAKQSLYTAHEVVQMRPLYMRGRVYEDFLQAQAWVAQYFPQAKPVRHGKHVVHNRKKTLMGDGMEWLARKLQLHIMSPRTRELISDTQLWFFPRDFEARLQKKNVI